MPSFAKWSRFVFATIHVHRTYNLVDSDGEDLRTKHPAKEEVVEILVENESADLG